MANKINIETNLSGSVSETYLSLPKSDCIQFQSIIGNWPSTQKLDDLKGNIREKMITKKNVVKFYSIST